MAYSDTTYSLDESASVLSIHPSTLLFWEEAFREELKIPRDPRGKLRFEERHLRAFVGIHRRILIEKRSLEETRLWLRKFYGQDAATAEMPGVTGTAVAGPVVGKIDALSQRVSELVESIDCLVRGQPGASRSGGTFDSIRGSAECRQQAPDLGGAKGRDHCPAQGGANTSAKCEARVVGADARDAERLTGQASFLKHRIGRKANPKALEAESHQSRGGGNVILKGDHPEISIPPPLPLTA